MKITIQETGESVEFKGNTLISRSDFEEMVDSIVLDGKEFSIWEQFHPYRISVAEYVSSSLIYKSEADLVNLLLGNIGCLGDISRSMRRDISEQLEMAFNDYDIRIAEDV